MGPLKSYHASSPVPSKVALLCLFLLAIFPNTIAFSSSPLKINDSGHFKILLFTDIHMGHGHEDRENQEIIKSLLELESPDLVVLGGDVYSNYAETAPSPKPIPWVKEMWSKVTSLLEGRYRWASILGNHDYGVELPPVNVTAFDASLNGSYTISSPELAYSLPIMDETGKKVVYRLYMFDSGTAGVDQAQVEWYLKESARLAQSNGGVVSPALGFVHIPLPEMMELYNTGKFRGYMGDSMGICCQVTENTMFDALASRKEIKVVTSGHDHGSDFVGLWEGIQLAYGRKTGEGGYNYGLGARSVGIKGGRVFLLQMENASQKDKPGSKGATLFSEYQPSLASYLTIKSWIRYANGHIDEQLEVGSTPPEHALTQCCVGPPDPMKLLMILTPTILLVSLVTVAGLFIVWYVKRRRLLFSKVI